jgi:putative Mg2+ transporter-C (MgtC) family protein
MDIDPQLLVRVLVAAACGAVVGLEREWRDKPAGVRTYTLVAIGSAVFTVGAVRFCLERSGEAEQYQLDPTRVIQGIVGGIGFLGAGAILHSHGSVEGLTTAAGVWVIGAVGVACGLGYFDLAIVTALLALIILGLVGFLPSRHPPAPKDKPSAEED